MSNILPNPQSGSADPSASLPALWCYIQPALDHIIRSPTNNLSKAPAVDINYHMGIHTALYNYFTNRAVAAPPPPPPPSPPSHLVKGTPVPIPPPLPPRGSSTVHSPGQEVYDRLDAYFADVAREVFLGAPLDDSALAQYLVPCFIRYSAGARSVDRLMDYLNRLYVKRAVDWDKGWPRFGDIISSGLAEGQAAALAPGRRSGVAVVKGGHGDGDEQARSGCVASHRRIAEKMQERRAAELRRWGAPPDGATAEQLALAEACAEAGGASECVVPVLSLAYRRFRTEVMAPLLAVPRPKGESKGRDKKKKREGMTQGRDSTAAMATAAVVPTAEANKAPRGRLARSVKEFLESKGGGEEERTRFAREMADMLMRVGIRPEHPLRRRLGKHCIATT